jgi:choline dehydrogenase-like flavoprotein
MIVEGRGRQVLSDARELASDQQLDADVCIVGAGPAGITVARELIGNGADVLVLESGGRDVERGAQRLNQGQSVGYPIHLPHQSRVRAFGGTSRHWFSPGDETWAAAPWTRSTSRSVPVSATRAGRSPSSRPSAAFLKFGM